ncbi:MAG: carboxylesterase family protein [Acidimicrobiales bacterium]|nr:carboxylesterase family protein [Acidimicrobiales bacterium]
MEDEAGAVPIASATSGAVRGTDEGIAVFKGIPYGTAERFMAPTPPKPWSGTRDALGFGNRSPQADDVGAALGGPADPAPMSEDCLALNVWTPGLDAGRRPVMVWFHGGGFSSLSGSSPMYDGVSLCQRGDVVVVTLNHRLNLFGFCYLAELGGERFADSGNAGMLDLVLALRWVRDNIATFGGDPDNVTVFGESGGGAKVSVLMGMPEAEGLFHRAIVQSGVHLHAQSPEQATANATKLMEQLDLAPDQVDQLTTMPFEHLTEALARLAPRTWGEVAFNPVADGVNLPRSPWLPDAPECSAQVPMIISSTRTETTRSCSG